MKIIVDENIPYGKEAFGTLGTVKTAPGRQIDSAMLCNADALVVRSITKVDESLLAGTSVKFVGTCTIGEDHIDKDYLTENNIAFTSAPGCNANSVGEYIIAALLVLANRYNLQLDTMTLGIVGVGNVGAKVYTKASSLGMTCILNDPPLADITSDPKYRPLSELLECDVITFHTPLEKGGNYPTWHLVDKEFLRWLKPNAIIINASRGAVVDTYDLEEALRTQQICAAVLDVWENEPTPNPELLRLTAIATSHIAGYSFDGKVNGTRQVYEELCTSLNRDVTWDPRNFLPSPLVTELALNVDEHTSLTGAVLSIYDIMEDDKNMRDMLLLPPEKHASYFDELRKNYSIRREFFNTIVRLSRRDNFLERKLAGIGFTLSNE
ncbi:MAG: 4-phosphoerythronate dehydrogenase [Candidatus Hydrogenedentes bacterium]|nr:4-phosphoerythronate dehydrogenase [Candidatus Hydrogenedentota bacterium]